MFYPDRQVNPKFNQGPIVKPLLPTQQPVGKSAQRFQKFGHNLGPSAPVASKTKYAQLNHIVQSPMLMSNKARHDTSSHYLINQNMLVQRIQDRINDARRQTLAKSEAKKLRSSRSTVGVVNLTYKHQSVTNNLQSPDYYRSYSRPSDTKAVENFYKSVQRQVAESKRITREFYAKGERMDKDMTEAKKKSPFLFSQLRNFVSSEPNLSRIDRDRLQNRSMNQVFERSGPLRSSFVNMYQTQTQMLQRGQAKHLAQLSTCAATFPIATKEERRPQTASKSMGPLVESQQLGRRKTKPEFFKTHYQHASDQLNVGSKFNKNKVKEFCYTRYKPKAKSNYESVPAASRNKALDNRQRDFQMRITVDNGEPGIPVSASTVYKPVPDHKRFVSIHQPQEDVFKENMCHSFVSVRNNKTLLKSAQKAKELTKNRDRFTQLGMKRKQGGGLFKQRVPPKPKHAIDFI